MGFSMHYSRHDIANVLQAIAIANTNGGDTRGEFLRALVSVGCAFGLEPTTEIRRAEEGQPLQIPKWVEAANG